MSCLRTAARPGLLSQQLQILKLSRRLRKAGSARLSALPREIEKSADQERIRALREEVADIYQRDPTCAAKYAQPSEVAT